MNRGERKAPLEPRTFTELRVAEPIRSRRPTKPLEYGVPNFGQLRCIQCAEFANAASDWVSGDALRDERALFEKRNSYFDFKLRVTQRGGMENNRDKGAVGIAEWNAENENRSDFLDHAAIEQPDFPRLGSTFLLTQCRGQCVAGGRGNVVVERAGIPRRKMVNDFSHELLLFLGW